MSGPRRTSRTEITALVVSVIVGLGVTGCSSTGSAIGSLGTSGEPRIAADGGGGHSVSDGYIADGSSVSPFDDALPAVAKLDAGLRTAVQTAASDAAADGVRMVIDSGWRSASYQQALLDEATVKYGSLEEARKWVNTPDRSAHVTGDAVDIGDTDADSWLSQHGANYGLCQIYSNEMWHFELAVSPGGMCPMQRMDAAG